MARMSSYGSPCEDHVENRLDVNEYLIDQPEATFFARVNGDSMRDAGLFKGDIVVVDRSKQPTIGNIVVAVIDGEFTIKVLSKTESGQICLTPANPEFPVILIKAGMDFNVWGVVTGSFRKFKKNG